MPETAAPPLDVQERVDRLEALIERQQAVIEHLQAVIVQIHPSHTDAVPGFFPELAPVSLKQAKALATEMLGRTISESTVRRMCIHDKIGWQLRPAGMWMVSKERLRVCLLGQKT